MVNGHPSLLSGREFGDVIAAALSQGKRRSSQELLRGIAVSLDAANCTLWRQMPTGEFFALAQWKRDGDLDAVHDLPPDSLPGIAVQRGKPSLTPASAAAPLTFGDGTAGALQVDWPAARRVEDIDSEALCTAARLAGALYDTVIDKVGYRLVAGLNAILNGASWPPAAAAELKNWAGTVFTEVARLLADIFECLEVSVFLEERLEKPGWFELAATTCREYIRQPEYRPGEPGPTGWALREKRVVQIFDLLRLEQGRDGIQDRYPGLSWRNWLHLAPLTRRLLGLAESEPLRPMSFIAVPVMHRGTVLGVIRCCYAREGSLYLGPTEAELLKVVAARVGRFWATALANAGWTRLVHQVIRLNEFAHRELQEAKPDEIRIFAEGLRVARLAIPGADILDVRLLNAERNELHFASTEGEAWKRFTSQQIQDMRYPVGGDANSAGVHVFQTQEVLYSEDPHGCRHYRELFPEVKRIICAPISAAETHYGVMGICGAGEPPFHPEAPTFAKLLGDQLGLYHSLAITIGRLNEIVAKQAQTSADMHHQLKNPIYQALQRVRSLVDCYIADASLERQLFAVRGIIRKADRVVRSMGLFSDLAEGRRPSVKKSKVDPQDLVKLLSESAKDTQLLVADRDIEFEIDRPSFGVLQEFTVEADAALLEQAANIVLDNAFKYAIGNTTVFIRVGIHPDKSKFMIEIIDDGIEITADEIRHAPERGWRGAKAKLVTGEGSGIGLWLLDHILRAHEGELEIVPTDEKGLTTVRLWLPCIRSKKGGGTP
jgi:signal transduction histidine kinase